MSDEPLVIRDKDYRGHCEACGATRWISVSLNGGATRVPQCVPCGAIHPGIILSEDAPVALWPTCQRCARVAKPGLECSARRCPWTRVAGKVAAHDVGGGDV